MNNYSVFFEGKEYLRISRIKALNILGRAKAKRRDNYTVYMLPCKLNPDSFFINGFFKITTDFNCNDYTENLKKVRDFEYYNCNSETGKYLAFYILK